VLQQTDLVTYLLAGLLLASAGIDSSARTTSLVASRLVCRVNCVEITFIKRNVAQLIYKTAWFRTFTWR